MGADGGSIPDRRDLVKTKGKAEVTDKALLRELYYLCALSKRPLARPVVLDPLGKLYNKDAVLEFFLDRAKYGDGDQICGYLKGVKDLLTLNLTPNPTHSPPSSSNFGSSASHAPFVCPLSLKEMSGIVPFIALRPCGCVFSDASIRAVIPNLTKGIAARAVPKDELPDEAKPLDGITKDKKDVACPNCGTTFDPHKPESLAPINPTRAVQEVLLEHLLTARAAAKSGKKRKATAAVAAAAEEKTTANGHANGTEPSAIRGRESDEPPAKIRREASDSPAPSTVPSKLARSSASPGPRVAPALAPTSLARSVHQKLAEQEQKRLAAQAGMSDAVKSMFRAKDGGKESDHASFFGRTFTRYAA
ncbi:hypothetical protein JCM24511_03999 [Saitozyma sp. JCM 24511]|nr:hypothetical protein JCM24511_03999 [Saitozyma sp. JCM 24511]